MQTSTLKPLSHVCVPAMPDQPDPGCENATRFFVVHDGTDEAGDPLLGIPLSGALPSLAAARAELEIQRTKWPDARIQRHVREVFPERAPA